MKNGKAHGVKEIHPHRGIKAFRLQIRKRLLDLFNNCRLTYRISTQWGQSKVCNSNPEAWKGPRAAQQLPPIPLLSHMFNLYERLILNQIPNHLDSIQIEQQVGFSPGESCLVKIMNESIEEGFEQREIVGVALIHLTAAYDTINYKTLLAITL